MGLTPLKVLQSNLNFPWGTFKPNPRILGGPCKILDYKSLLSSALNRFLGKMALGDYVMALIPLRVLHSYLKIPRGTF